ncbi:putative amidoligase enzyme-domain-containing protein [Xylariomycetidae sp. FL2044]|nr:putative amidoligase enzyme-domain-containing protein [Xylariomycetidae sp. FL2044]
MASHLAIQFGVEIELLLGSRSKKHKSWKSLASELSLKLIRAGIPNHLNEGFDKSPDNYQEWSLVQEVTVPAQAGKHLWGLELVSPIFFTPDAIWATHLTTIFKVLKAGFTVTPSAHCSTHVHISTSPPLDASQLSSIAKSILYFEPALDALLPPDRASSYWCQSNRASQALKSLTLPECFEYLDTYCSGGGGGYANDENDNGVSAVAAAMCLFPAQSAYGRAHGHVEDFVHGVYKWDFSGLLEGGIGTLEFRQAPGSRSAEDVRTWVELVVGFVAGAVLHGAMLDPRGGGGEGGQVGLLEQELWWLLGVGAETTQIGDLVGVEKLFVQGGGGQGGGRGGGGGGTKGRSSKR